MAGVRRRGLRWFDWGDLWVDFSRRKVFRYRYVLEADINILRAKITESQRPSAWESHGSPLVPGEWRRPG